MRLLLENWREYIKEEEEVNEIFGMGKDTADIDSETLRKVFETQLAADDIERLVKDAYSQRKGDSRRENLRSLLTKAIRLYEEDVDPLLSQMMVVRSQIDDKTRRWPTDLDPDGVGGVMSYKLSNPASTLDHASKVLYRARGQLLGLYAKSKQDAGLPPYDPPKSMYDLEKLMDTAKER